jgi:flagellar FliL protein
MAEIEQQVGNEKNRLKKMIIIISVAVLLAGAAGAGAVFFFLKGDSAKTEHAAHESAEEVTAEKLYYDMDKAFIVNFPKGSSARAAQISVSFLVAGEETSEALKKHEPMIRNNLLMMISAQGVETMGTREGKEKLRAAMLHEVTEILKKMTGKSPVEEVFFTSFVMQ